MRYERQQRRVGRMGRQIGVITMLALGSWLARGEGLKDMERVEEWMFWNEGMLMNAGGEVFEQGDSVNFVEDVVVGLMDDIRCGTVRVERGIEVTMMPYSGNLYMDELQLEGTLVFTAPWVLSNHWVIHAGEEGKIVMDMGYFDVELGVALPGEYEGDLEIRSGRMRYREDTGELHFKSLTITDGAQLALEEGSDYTGEIVLSGKGWIKNDGETGKGCVLFKNGGENRATLGGHIALAGETVLNVAREEDCGVIEGELDAAGHKLVKVGQGELRVEGGRVSGLDGVEVDEGKLIFMEDVETQRLHVSGTGELELQGKGNRLGLLELEEETRVEMQAGEIGELRGTGGLTVTGGELRLEKINDFSGELHGKKLWLGGISVEEGAEATVDLLDFERIEVSDGESAEVRSVRAAGGTTIGGGGELRLRAERLADGELNTGNLTIDGAHLHLLQPKEGGMSEMARVEVREGGSLYVEAAREGGNTQLHVEELELRRGSRLELVFNLGAALSSGEGDTARGLLSGSVRSEAGALLSLRVTGIDDDFEFDGGHYMEFLLADEFAGEISLDDATEDFMQKYFGNSGQLVVRDGMLLFTGTTVTEEAEQPDQGEQTTPGGQEGGELPEDPGEAEDPQQPQQGEQTPPEGQEGGELPGDPGETENPQHPQQGEQTPPEGQEGGELPDDSGETEEPQHPQQDEPTPPEGHEGGELPRDPGETEDPQHPQQGEPTPPEGQEGGELPGDSGETEDPQHPQQGEPTPPAGQEGGELPGDSGETEDPQHPQQGEPTPPAGQEEGELPGDSGETEDPQQPQQDEPTIPEGQEGGELPDDSGEAEDPQQPQQGEPTTPEGQESGELPGDSGETGEPQHPQQGEPTIPGGQEGGELPDDSGEKEEPQQPQQGEPASPEGQEEGELPEDPGETEDPQQPQQNEPTIPGGQEEGELPDDSGETEDPQQHQQGEPTPPGGQEEGELPDDPGEAEVPQHPQQGEPTPPGGQGEGELPGDPGEEEVPQHPQQGEPAPPGGQESGELPRDPGEEEEPQHPQQGEPAPPGGQESGELPGDNGETGEPQHPQQGEQTPPEGQESGELPGDSGEEEDPQHPQQDEPTIPGGQEEGELPGDHGETEDPQHPQQGEPTIPGGQEGGELPDDSGEKEEPQQPQQGEPASPEGQEEGELPEDPGETEDPQQPQQNEPTIPGGQEEGELPDDSGETEDPQQHQQGEPTTPGGQEEGELPDDSGETEEPQQPQQDEPTPPGGQEEGELPDDPGEAEVPQHPQQGEPTPPGGQGEGELPGDPGEEEVPQHPQQGEPAPPGGQESGELPRDPGEEEEPQHPQQDEPTPPEGQEGGELPRDPGETEEPQQPQQGEPTPPEGQESGELPDDHGETEDPQHPQQGEQTPPGGQESGELPDDSGETEETHPHQEEATTPNGQAGGGLLDDIVATDDPQHHETGDRTDVLEEEEDLISQGKHEESDHLSSAVAGSSLPTLSMALSHAAEAGLRGLAERMSGELEPCKGEEGKGWMWNLQADGTYARLEKKDTFSGYTLRTAGGTVGARKVVSDGKGSIGATFSVEHGNWRASAEDVAHGQVNAAFFTVYGAYLSGKWRHFFAAQGGACTMSPERRVSIGKVSYTVAGRTHGYEAGALYELMYCGWIAEGSEGGLRPFLQAMWQRVDVAGYSERGSDAALHVGGQTLMRGIVGVGMEWSGQTQFAERRVCWSLRGEVYANLGDRESEARVAFVRGRGHSEKVRSARESVPGIELAGGLYLPTGAGTWYTVGGVDLQNRSWSARITLGYRISF